MSMLLRRAMMAASARAYATWDAATKGADCALSNGNLTHTADYTVGTAHSARATIGKTTGKWYWECNNTSMTPAPPMIGICTAALPIAVGDFAYPAPSAGYGTGIYASNGGLYINGAASSYYGAGALNDVYGFALDAGTRVLTIYRNNTALVVCTAIGGTDAIYPAVGYSGVSVANFGATALTYSPPSGYNAGLYA